MSGVAWAGCGREWGVLVTADTRRVPLWLWPGGLGAAAAACAAIVTVSGGPVRFAAGLVLALCLPGSLGVLVLRRDTGRDGVFVAALVVPLSIAATAAVGLLVAAAGWSFRPAVVGWLLAAVCLALGVAAASTGPRAARPEPRAARPEPRAARPEPRAARPEPRAARASRYWRYWWAALPALALTVVLVLQLGAATRQRTPDSYYTEFAIQPSGSVLVHSRERATTRFRYEVRVGGTVRQSAGFSLRPGERREFPLRLGPDERADVRLYRADGDEPYRRLTP